MRKRAGENSAKSMIDGKESTERRHSLRELISHRNRFAILLFELTWGLAMPLMYHATMVPGYLRYLGIANAWIGLVPAIHTGIYAIIQPYAAFRWRPGPRRVTVMRLIYVLTGAGYVLLGLLVLRGFPLPAAGLAVVLAVELLAAVTTGAGDPQYANLVVESISPRQRGFFFGLRAVLLGVGGIVGGLLAAHLLKVAVAPSNFGASFVCGGTLLMLSTLSMALYRDRPPQPEDKNASFRGYLQERVLPRVRHTEFRTYLAASVLFTLSTSGFTFVSLLLKAKLNETEGLLGFLGSLFMAANLTQSWVLGVVCDRWGSRAGFILGLVLYTAGLLGCVFGTDRAFLLAAYFCASVWFPTQIVAAQDLAYRLAEDAPPAEIFSTTMVVLAPARIFGPLLAGAAIDRWMHGPPLLVCAGLACLAALVLVRPAAAPRPRT